MHICAKDPKVGPTARWNPCTSVDGSLHDINTVLAVEGNCAISLAGSDRPIGSIGLKSRAIQKTVSSSSALSDDYKNLLDNAKELGYWIGRPYWGKGIATEALSTVLRHGFSTLRIEAMRGDHYDTSVQSARVMEKCEMRKVIEHQDDFYSVIGQNKNRQYK
ncbi:GNAT family N-acetyltransferase [Bifidobacterium coryneforme]|uniref:GNAT family N-acetyltransferase n=1 Tax=Bifidobacterium coryneforme TaxID=1687 RepID=UPI0009E01729|nr:GNAT family N-acetyltransferase [Bifidobacterium indicum]